MKYFFMVFFFQFFGKFTPLKLSDKQIRNEEIDMIHNPEFYSLESYEAYSDYNDLMVMTEELLPWLVKKVNGSLLVNYDSKEIDFTPFLLWEQKN